MNSFNDPVCSIHKNHLKDNPEHWCKEVLLYSPNNPDYHPESRVHLYTKPALTPENKLITEALKSIVEERQRQVSTEGYSEEHDDEHTNFALCRAGAAYSLAASGVWRGSGITDIMSKPMYFPKDWDFKPDPVDQRKNLVKAAALILAEIERLDRRKNKK